MLTRLFARVSHFAGVFVAVLAVMLSLLQAEIIAKVDFNDVCRILNGLPPRLTLMGLNCHGHAEDGASKMRVEQDSTI